MKSAGYDPDRPWDKEEALFAEAKRDMERLRAEDRGETVPEYEEVDHDHDDFFGRQDNFERAEEEEEEEVPMADKGQEAEDGVAEEAPQEEGQEVPGIPGVEAAVPAVGAAEADGPEADQGVDDGALFLPGGDQDDDA